MNDNALRIGILLGEKETEKLLEVSSFMKKTPQKFVSDIIESTYRKVQIFNLDWEDDE
jgi:hypothetical protein